MSGLGGGPDRGPSTVLVVDDDRRVVELLTIALAAYGYRVLSAADGDEALRVAVRERPDLIVLDVRLPKKSGLEVCEQLRQDPEDPRVPIIMVSAAAETESRLQGLGRGADDYLAKPFSPKELIARIRGLLARAAESREARRRGLEAERELARAREEARRGTAQLRAEQRLRELAHTLVRDFHGPLDRDVLAARILLAAQSHLQAGFVSLLCPADPGAAFRPVAVRGDLVERVAEVSIRPEGELAALLLGLARPVRQRELERFHGLADELAPVVAAGFALLAPLRGPEGMEGVLLADERPDGRSHGREELEGLAVLCETAALALFNARRFRGQADGLLGALLAWTRPGMPHEDPGIGVATAPGAPGTAEPAALEAERAIAPLARVLLPPRERDLLTRALGLSQVLERPEGRSAMAAMAGCDSSGAFAALVDLVDRAGRIRPWADPQEAPERRRAAGLLAAGLAYAGARTAGLGVEASRERALERARAALDQETWAALETALGAGPAGQEPANA